MAVCFHPLLIANKRQKAKNKYIVQVFMAISIFILRYNTDGKVSQSPEKVYEPWEGGE
jgi:hypothetical protein